LSGALVRRDLGRIFDYRHEALRRIFQEQRLDKQPPSWTSEDLCTGMRSKAKSDTRQQRKTAVKATLESVASNSRRLLQPAVKCRGREYLRIIYGPEYTLPEHLTRLRERGLSGKRSLALCEFALGTEGHERFVQREPLRRVHECVFGVLALEREPVDPRL
jgi:PNKP adenylyltransferase domain, ligase domain